MENPSKRPQKKRGRNTSSLKSSQNENSSPSTSWEEIGLWYDGIVGKTGHYFHEQIILPKTLELLNFNPNQPAALLDLACGQGILARSLPSAVSYVGIDASSRLIQSAKNQTKREATGFYVGDVTKELPIAQRDFTHATVLLALQNISHPLKLFQIAAKNLRSGGTFVLVFNHPCFRIPRQTAWGIDPHTDIQYRRIDRYLSPLEIPIQTHPGVKKDSSTTLSFHHPLSAYSEWLFQAGFVLERIQEWCSNKVSDGKAARRENRARSEFPLFMAIRACKA